MSVIMSEIYLYKMYFYLYNKETLDKCDISDGTDL